MPVPYPLADHRLAQRLERTEGDANRRFVEARARAEPPSGASWTEVDGTYVMFDGVESPLTQTFGLGISGPVTSTTFERIERYFSDRGATTFHEVSPLADASTLPQLHARGYEAFEFSSVLFQPLPADPGLARRAPSTYGRRLRRKSIVGHRRPAKAGVNFPSSRRSCARSAGWWPVVKAC